MLRHLIVCALLAQTLALSRPSRRAWPSWMKEPEMDWPDWMRMPTSDDLPEVTIPDIDLPELPTLPQVDIPDIRIPDINMQMPDAAEDVFQRWWNPSQSSRSNGGQRGQSWNGNGRGQGNSERRPGYQNPQHSSSNGQWSWSWQDSNNRQGSNGQTNRGRPDTGRQTSRQEQQQGSTNGRGEWPRRPQTEAQRPSQTNPRGQGPTNRGRPDTGRQPTRQEPQQGSTNGRGEWPRRPQTEARRPSQTNPRGQGPTNRGRPDTGRQPTRQEPQQGSTNGRGEWPRRPSQTNPRGQGTTNRERPDTGRQPTWQEPQRGSTNGRGDWPRRPETVPQRPSQTTPLGPGKERKQRPQPREGPPQRQEPVSRNPKLRRQPGSKDRIPTRTRSEPSVGQQVEQFRLGMPNWMQDELTDTFTTMRHEIDQGRLEMDSWAEDIQTAAQEWWERWSGSTSTNSRRPGRPTAETNGRHEGRYRDNGRHGGRYGDNSQHGGRYGNNGRHGGRYGDRGHSRYPSKEGGRKWYNNTACKRPFRPRGDRPSREEPVYRVLCGGDDYEARLYNSSVWVSVTVHALTYDLAVHKAYMKLYRYINGHNSHGAEVTRTVPVHTKVKSNARENRWFERHNYTISFYLPEDVHINPPTPNDSELFIEHEEPTVYYAHSFRGYALEFNIWEYLDELTGTLEISREAYKTEDYVVNVYDAPWKFFNRRNEILVAMDTDLLEIPSCTAPTTTTEPPMTSRPETTTGAPPTPATTRARPTTKATPPSRTVTPKATTPTPKAPTIPTKEATTPVRPTIIGEIPAAIILPGIKNPFENNGLEQGLEADCEQGSECPRSETAVTYDKYELRHYAYSRWICMDQAACNLERAQKLTQTPLLEYFYPKGNREQIKMMPTTPLVIGMDVSDLNSTDCGKMYTSCLFLPEEHQGAPPTPRDARLYLQDIPAMSRYVMPFGGFATSQNVPKLGVEFLMMLENSKLPYDGSIVAVAQYTTSKLAKTRLNELWVMDQSLLQGNLGME